MLKHVLAIVLAAGATTCLAQPTITSLGGGVPFGVTNNLSGSYYIGGSGLSSSSASRWVLSGSTLVGTEIGGTGGGGYISLDGQFQVGQWLNTGPQIFGNTASSVNPPFNPNPTLVPSTTLPAATEFAARRFSAAGSTWQSLGGLPIVPSLIAYGSSSSGGSTGNFLSGHAISSDGRFVVGLGYVCTYNNAGTAVSANSFRWRPWIWDAQANGGAGAITILPTPFRTSSNTSLRRTGNAYAVSTDGTVVLGAQEHNVGGSGGDSANHAVWRKNAGTGEYEITLLAGGALSTTPSALAMNAAGTIIVGRATDGTNSFLGKWTWNTGTLTWDGPQNLGANLATPASWLPGSVTSCGIPPSLGGSIAMTEDGNTIVGSAVYSTCGSFMSGGFICRIDDGGPVIQDWYDYNVARSVPGVATGGFFGPVGDGGDPSRGLPVLGFPTAISPDGSAVVGFQGGTQRIIGAPPWIIVNSGGPACVGPTITLNPSATTNFSACTSSIILNVASSGTPPLTYQWFKDGNPLSDGTQPSGSTVTGATSFQMRVNPPLTPADAGTYYAVVTGSCGSPATSTNSLVQLDPAFPAAINDTCATATPIIQGTNVLGAGESACGAYVNDPASFPTCISTAYKTDRWYSFTPTTSGNYRIETCGANFDTFVTISSDCFGSEIACNDNYLTGPTTGCTSTRSRILSVALTANTSYLIRVAAPSSAFLSGTSVINLSILPAPLPAPNDACSTATTAVIGPNPFDLTEATPDTTASCNPALSRDVWHVFTPTASGLVRFSTCGTTLNTVMSVYDACFGVEVACNDNANISGCTNQSVIDNYVALAGVPNYIRIGASSATGVGSGNLTISTIGCDSIDFNNDGGLFDPQDIDALLSVFSEGDCIPSTALCNDIDFNNDGGLFDPCDVASFLRVFSEGPCTPCGV